MGTMERRVCTQVLNFTWIGFVTILTKRSIWLKFVKEGVEAVLHSQLTGGGQVGAHMEAVVSLVEEGPELDLEVALIHHQAMEGVAALDRLPKDQDVTTIDAHPDAK